MTSPAFGTSQRVLAYDLPRTGCRSLWTRTMPLAMFWVAPARPSACAALALRTLPPRSARLAGVAARKQERYVFDANDQKTQRVIKIWQTFPGLGISHIPAAPRPSDVAPGAAMEFDICGTRPSPGARTKENLWSARFLQARRCRRKLGLLKSIRSQLGLGPPLHDESRARQT